MKIDLIGMILSNTKPGLFDGLVVDDNGKELDAAHALDQLMRDYAKVKSGGTSDIVAVHNLD